ncbi:MAG: 1-acyl-sn-glycerol-3-phosphate acyltransferase [Lachnospiraceae bacterium]|nr:1-acyl-sn-glycerol-3-phosphate acyltransferase [Lachnospiraceae bacterium]
MWSKFVDMVQTVTVAFLYVTVLPVLHLIYPRKMVWEDKKASKEILKQKCVIYSNHTGYSDGLFVFGLFAKYHPYTFIGKDWYEKKAINWIFSHQRFIPIDRTQMDTSWLVKGKKVTDEGSSIYFFPEGHTSKDGLMLEFQPGFLMLAKQCDTPLIPVCLDRKIEPFKLSRVIIGKPQFMDLKEEGRPSLVLKKYAAICKESVIDLKDRFGDPKFVTDDVLKLREKKASLETT